MSDIVTVLLCVSGSVLTTGLLATIFYPRAVAVLAGATQATGGLAVVLAGLNEVGGTPVVIGALLWVCGCLLYLARDKPGTAAPKDAS